jgi:hypothetical protein
MQQQQQQPFVYHHPYGTYKNGNHTEVSSNENHQIFDRYGFWNPDPGLPDEL